MKYKALGRIMRGVLVSAGVCLVLVVASLWIPLDGETFSPAQTISLRILDRNGILLREVLSEKEGRGRWCTAAEIPPHVVHAVLAAEDARFHWHPGVDPLAILRAGWQNLQSFRIVSGGSTITQQVIRNVFPSRRTLLQKIREAWLALRLERMMTKEDILIQYLNRVPFGSQTFGVDAASRFYFGKPLSQVSIAEAALLAALPNSPTLNDPLRSFDRARLRQLYVLRRMTEEGFISPAIKEQAEHEPLVLAPAKAQFKAPHFTTMVLRSLPSATRSHIGEVRTTLDYNIQKTMELLLQAHLERLRKHDVSNGALVVIDNVKHELRALVGSKNFFDTTTSGQVNGALALRQPGSTLKPFTYGIALELGMTAAQLLADIPRLNGDSDIDFLPENYDKRYHGPVRLRTALACSYNVPAVRTLEQFGEELLLRKLHAAGFESLRNPSSHYGVGLTLGNGEVTLLELANAYSALANEGMFVPLRIIDHGKGIEHQFASRSPDLAGPHTPTRIFSRQVAYLLTDILSDAEARAPAFGRHSSLTLPFPCAAKTGTSKDYRDNWAVGYTPRFTVAVWVGNFNAKPMKLVSGITGAAVLFRDAMLVLHQSEHSPREFTRPEGIVARRICPRSGMKPGKDCPGELTELFLAGTEAGEFCTVHRAFRIDGRNGLLASKTTPHEFVVERVFEIFSPLYQSWVQKEGIQMPPSGTGAGEENSHVYSNRKGSLAINSPTTGEIFKLDPVLRPRYQTITVDPVVPSDVEDVWLLVNGDAVAPLTPPYRYRLPLASLRKGPLTLVVKGRRGANVVQSEPVRIAVQ